jgi:branched-chain amino acid transport system substrate-binding protein
MKSRSNPIRLIPAAALLAGTALLLSACATAGSVESNNSAKPTSGGTLTVGYIGPLTGGSASLGVTSVDGMQLAVDQLNKSGNLGFKLKLDAVDDAADAAKSASAAQQMITEDSPIAVIGGPNSGPVQANNPIITGAGVVNLISIAQVDTLVSSTRAGFPLTFRVTETNSYDVQAIASLFVKGKYKEICAVADTTAYGQGGIATIQTVFKARGLTLAHVVQHEANATDLTSQVLSLRDAGCDSVYLYDLGQDAALFMKTVNQVGWKVPVIGGRALAQQAFISVAGKAGDGIIIPSVIDPTKASAKAFIKAYDAKYGADSDPAHVFSAIGYDTIQVLAKALEASKGQGGTTLSKALEKTSITGVTGRVGSTLGFSASKHEAPSKNYLTFWIIKDGKYAFYSNDVASGTN